MNGGNSQIIANSPAEIIFSYTIIDILRDLTDLAINATQFIQFIKYC